MVHISTKRVRAADLARAHSRAMSEQTGKREEIHEGRRCATNHGGRSCARAGDHGADYEHNGSDRAHDADYEHTGDGKQHIGDNGGRIRAKHTIPWAIR